MICQNCQSNVADDLVFCTECGSRLHETVTSIHSGLSEQTLVIPKSQQNKITPETSPKKSKVKWLMAAILLILIPLAGIGSFFVYKFGFSAAPQKPTPVPTKSPARRKSPTPEKTPVAASPTPAEENKNSNSEPDIEETPINITESILDDRISIDADEHVAFPFKIDSQSKLEGTVSILRGESYEGYVYTQEGFDEHFPDPDHKMFSFGDGTESEIGQYLPKGNYVIVFINTGTGAIVLNAKFSKIPQN